MKTMFSGRIRSLIFTVAVLTAATCASIATGEANTIITDDTTSITIAKGQFVNPGEMTGVLQPFGLEKSAERIESTPYSDKKNRPVLKGAETRILSGDAPFITIMSAPAENSRTIATLKSGQPIKVMKTKDSWMKITWQIDDTLNQGWLKKSFVEGKSIHALR